MKIDEGNSPAFVDLLPYNAPYSSSLATSASGSSTSVWSDASSQNSDDTSITAPTSDSDSCDSTYSLSRPNIHPQSWVKQHTQAEAEVPPELRLNPRRTCNSAISRSGCPPTLVRQSDRKVNFVDNLVDSATQIVEAIWPTSSVVCRNETGTGGVLPLRTFIQETLRRSRTSYSTFQVALYYLILIKPHVPNHDFTMEQLEDTHATRALQCGRRMFLAALILASKYLQDRNYSARAWSKISGLNTQEINQNEMAFVTAVNWKLHITDEVYTRWTDCVMKHPPSQPPSPGNCAQQLIFERHCEDFKTIILNLNPELDNLDEILAWSSPKSHRQQSIVATSPKYLYTPTHERKCVGPFGGSPATTPTQKLFGTPAVMEPTPASVHIPPGRPAPALGLLPTPRLAPQSSGFSTPAASAASYLLGKTSMSVAMAQVNTTSIDRFPVATTSPPGGYAHLATRRSSLANTASTASSPESMVSDSSLTSRSSSISSASSTVSAPSTKLDVQARYRYAKQCSERMNLRPAIAPVPEVYEEDRFVVSPECYTGPVGKDFRDLSVETPLARQGYDAGDDSRNSINDAARALHELQNYRHGSVCTTPVPAKKISKRSRTDSTDTPLQADVREMLAGRYTHGDAAWSETLVRPYLGAPGQPEQIQIHAPVQGGRKRVCCSAEAAERFTMPSYPFIGGGFGGPGMWAGILN